MANINSTLYKVQVGEDTYRNSDVIPAVTGTSGTAAVTADPFSASIWRVDLSDKITELYAGLTILYKVPVAGNKTYGTLLRIDGTTASGDSSSNLYPVCANVTTMIGTRYAVGCVVPLTFDPDQVGQTLYYLSSTAYTTAAAGTGWTKKGCWKVADYSVTDTDTIGYSLRYNNTVRTVTDTARYYKIYFTSADGTQWVPASATSTNSAATAIAVNQRPIDPFGEIVYTSASTKYSAGGNLAETTIWQQYNITLGYSFNRTGAALTLTSKSPVYIKCAPQANGSAIIDKDTPYVQALPNTDDGKIYIYLGTATSATLVEMSMKHPIYYYKYGAIRQWTNCPIDEAIKGLPEPMIFKGTVGTGGTVTWTDLPSAAGENEGWTYKVVSDHTADTKCPACIVGDTIISNGSEWVVVPSGDNPLSTGTAVTSVTATTDSFILSISPNTASVITSVSVKGAVTSITPTTSKLTTTTITAVGGTVTASAASAGTAKTLLTSLNPSTTTISGVSGTVTASKASAGTAVTVITKVNPSTTTIYGVGSTTVTASKASATTDISSTIVSSADIVSAITTATYNSLTLTLTFGAAKPVTVNTATLTIPQYTFTDVTVPVKNANTTTVVSGFTAASTTTITPYTFTDVTVPKAASGTTVVTGFGTNGTTTMTPYTFTTVTAATPASAGTVVATGGASSSSTGATIVTAVSSTGTANNLTVTTSGTSAVTSLGTPTTANAVTGVTTATDTFYKPANN